MTPPRPPGRFSPPRPPRRPAYHPARGPAPRPARVRLGSPARRLRFGLAVLLVLFAALGGRLVQLQGLEGTAYAAQAEQQRMREVVLTAPRGEILDRNGAVLARTVQARAIFADPTMVTDRAGAAAKLAPLLHRSAADLVAAMNRPGRFVYLARGADPTLAEQVMKLGIAGIGTLPETKREVPGHTLAANVIGFTNADGTGVAGIEEQYNSVLSGVNGKHQFEVGHGGDVLPGGFNKQVAPVPGSTVQTTIDSDLQYVADQALTARAQQVKAYSGYAVVMDAKTGQVLAMSNYPSFDAANPAASPPQTWTNGAISDVIEPGSVHKAITLGGALQEGVINANSAPVVPPTITKGGQTYSDTHPHGIVRLTLMGILAQSSNVATIEIATKLGADKLYAYQQKFGLGSPTGIGLPGESGGIVQPPANWSGPAYGGIPIGLGVAVTPLQMTSVYATVANDGVKVQPSIVAGIRSPDGTFRPAPPPTTTRVISAANAKTLRWAMSAITTTEGTGHAAAIPGYVIAGKTGTGNRAKNGKYLPGNVASFIGMAPYTNPRYVVGVFVHTPSGVGGAVAGPIFKVIMTYLLRHYGIPPDAAQPALSIYR